MASWQTILLRQVLRWRVKRRLSKVVDIAEVRGALSSGAGGVPRGVRIAAATLGGVPGEWVEAGGGPALLYLHGGGYFACSPRTHRPITAAFARRGFRVFAPDYRLAPEHPFPAAVEDAVAAYLALRAAAADSPVVLAGDSAGGGLALALLLSLRDQGAPMPAGAALFSPWTDLAATGESLAGNDRRDPMFFGEGIARGAAVYLAGADPRTPLASPLYADYAGLPPLLIHVGESEVLRDDSTRLAARAQADGVPVDLTVWPAVPHAWQIFGFLPETRRSLDRAAAFLHAAIPAEAARQAA